MKRGSTMIRSGVGIALTVGEDGEYPSPTGKNDAAVDCGASVSPWRKRSSALGQWRFRLPDVPLFRFLRSPASRLRCGRKANDKTPSSRRPHAALRASVAIAGMIAATLTH